jgi:DNA-binding CsgD family transcriptional regulator
MGDAISLELQILDALGVPLLVKDQQGVYVYANQKISDLMRVPKEEIVGKTVYDLAPAPQADHCTKDDAELFAKGNDQKHTIFVETNKGAGVVQFDRKAIVSKQGVFIIETVQLVTKLDGVAFKKLTARETEVLALVMRGQATKEVARSLAMSPFTVNDHLKSIYKKLDVKNKTAAIQKVIGAEAFLKA